VKTASYKRVLINSSIGCAALGVLLLVTYVAFGHSIIDAIYHSDFPIVQRLMPGKGATTLQSYMAGLDEAVLRLAVYFVLSALALLLALNPVGLVLSAFSFFVGSLAIFLVVDRVPELIKPLRLDVIPYYTYRVSYLPDAVLGYRSKPFLITRFTGYRGAAYSPLLGINVPPQSGMWQTDDEGFRNPAPVSSAEIAVIGSSMVEWGNDDEDTYPSKLERQLGGQKVVNLGKAGYGPLQYLEVLKRYAVEKKPQYVILTFYPAYDVDDQLADWVHGRKDKSVAKYTVGYGQFFGRYKIAIQQTSEILIDGGWTALQLGFRQIIGPQTVHPDLAVLRLPNGTAKKILFVNHHTAKSTEQLLQTPEWQAMENLLVEFKRVCDENQIVPVMLYIPTASEVYAEYSTLESGANWLAVRKSQISTSGNNEDAARILADQVGIRMVSVLPAFKEAARQGKLVYYQLDAHWNEAGRELAAEVTAKALKSLRPKSATASEKQKPKSGQKKRRHEPSPTEKGEPTVQEAMLDQLDGVMVRTLDGKINFWNSGAQHLYGWSTNEAIGKVSHDLLRTQFPEPLAKIDAELRSKGEWHGKLVHATRDGRRVVVQSRWVLKPKSNGAVLEINTPAGTS
jgi:PAS domain S-box-containing protein